MINKNFKLLVNFTTKINLKFFTLQDMFDCFIRASGGKFESYMLLEDLIEGVSVKEFLSVYPLKKEYDGDKYGFKDYNYSIEFLKTFIASGNEILTRKNIMEFLMEVELETPIFRIFISKTAFCGADEIRRKKGQPSMMSMFLDYHVLDNSKKPKPNYLRVCN